MNIIKFLNDIDVELFLFLNNLGCDCWDDFWLFMTGKFSSIPLYLLIAYLLKRNRKWKDFLVSLLFVVILIAIVDSSINLIKGSVCRLRPCHFLDVNTFRLVKSSCGGMYGFVSAHAGNSFAFSTFIFLCLKGRYKYIWTIFIWASLTAYSRIYIGVHYPLDVIFGGFYGFLWGRGLYEIKNRFFNG